MKILFVLAYIISVVGVCTAQTTVNYLESSEIIANPERGLQKYSITNSNYNTQSNYSSLSQTTLTGWRTGNDKVSVIFRYFLLSNFLESDISETYLNNIQKDFDIIRDAGLKCIVRFSYSNGQSSAIQQPVKSLLLSHINQISPLLEANKDIIFSHQAGFLGTWGEWYYTNSTEFGTDGSISAVQWANRKEIIDAMLAATPLEIPIQVRYPKVKRNMYGSTQLTESTAYQNTPIARIGFYNDAFLNSWGDMGSYSVSGQYTSPIGSADYNYLANETKYTPMTGETNGLNAPRTDGNNAVNEMDLTNWTTLNRDYYTANFTNWINSGHYPEILRRLGYRFVLEKGKFQLNGNKLDIELVINNVGFARMFKKRDAWIILKNSDDGNEYPFLLDSDPRTWEGVMTLNQLFDLSELPMGNYDCYLNLPDSDSQLSSRSEYSVRFANQDVWMEDSGYNNLQFSFYKGITNVLENELGVSNNNRGSLNLVPNPASDKLVVKGTGLSSGQSLVKIFSINGQFVSSQQIQSSNGVDYKLDVSSLSAGVYLLVVTSKDGGKQGVFVKKSSK